MRDTVEQPPPPMPTTFIFGPQSRPEASDCGAGAGALCGGVCCTGCGGGGGVGCGTCAALARRIGCDFLVASTMPAFVAAGG